MRGRWLIYGLFCPATVGLLVGLLLSSATGLAHSVLRLGTWLLSIEQARVAVLDWQNIQQVAATVEDGPESRLTSFRRLTVAVIGLELLGFYLAIGWPGWGALTVLVAQVLFNGGATIALFPQAAVPVVPWGLRERLPVLVADLVGVALAGLWILDVARLGSAIALLTLVLVYLIFKYASELGQPVPPE
ncbi:MAG: hypothetical protein AAFZ80_07730 [Cyanobacteria bacterium P01_A01_bin.105]